MSSADMGLVVAGSLQRKDVLEFMKRSTNKQFNFTKSRYCRNVQFLLYTYNETWILLRESVVLIK